MTSAPRSGVARRTRGTVLLYARGAQTRKAMGFERCCTVLERRPVSAEIIPWICAQAIGQLVIFLLQMNALLMSRTRLGALLRSRSPIRRTNNMVWQYEYFLKQINKQQLSSLIELV
jgi:hypothetical protein